MDNSSLSAELDDFIYNTRQYHFYKILVDSSHPLFSKFSFNSDNKLRQSSRHNALILRDLVLRKGPTVSFHIFNNGN